MSRARVTGSFADEETCAQAVRELRRAGLGRITTFSPFASEAVLEALETSRSRLRWWVLLGGITGCLGGFALTIGLSTEYPHVTAGMPVVSIPPFVIIAFELTILCGALSAVLAFLAYAGLPSSEPVAGWVPAFTADRFGVAVDCAAADAARAEHLLTDAGALEVGHASAGGAGHGLLACVAAVGLLLSGRSVHAFPWSHDMFRGPAVQPLAAPPRNMPSGTRSRSAEPSQPPAPTPARLRRGADLFAIHCAPCHGAGARGDGAVAARLRMAVPDLTRPPATQRSARDVYDTIRTGGPLMPAYGDALSPVERWEVVLHLRRLQEGIAAR